MAVTTIGHRSVRLHRAAALAVGSLLTGSLAMAGAPAQAEPPTNDNWQTPTQVGALPLKTTIDTSEATSDDPAPAGMRRRDDHSVFYQLTTTDHQRLLFSTQGTHRYSPYLTLYRRTDPADPPDVWTKIVSKRIWRDSSGGFVQQLRADGDYVVMISSYRDDPGGTATLLVRQPARTACRLAATGVYDRTDGAALLKGQLKSTGDVTVSLRATLRQVVGDHVVEATGYKDLVATTEWAPWVMRVAADQPFKPGPARVSSSVLRVYDAGVRLGTYHFARTLVILQ